MISSQTITNAVNFYENKIQTQKKDTASVKTKEKATDTKKTTKANEEQLSTDAKKLLDSLRKKYKEYDFMVSAAGDDKKALLSGSKKEFSVLFSKDELEKMAQDESYAKEKIRTMETAVKMSKRINEEFGLLPTGETQDVKDQMINKIGISFNEDGTMSLFAELEKVSESQKAYLEKMKENKAAQKKEEAKEAEKKPSAKDKEASVKKVTVEASTEEELVEKIKNVDWNKVIGESVGARFDLTI